MQSDTMRPLADFKISTLPNLKYIFTDVDDTITSHGSLLPKVYESLCNLSDAGYKIIPVTGGPAGWCDCILRMWPVKAIVGESGAFYMHQVKTNEKIQTRHLITPSERVEYEKKLNRLKTDVQIQFPGISFASDQFCRLYDLAIELSSVNKELNSLESVKHYLIQSGLTIKISSIHINTYFGNWDKLSTTKMLVSELWGLALEQINEQCIFIGDSLNDESMFGFFNHSFGVANVLKYKDQLKNKPKWVTNFPMGLGFIEIANSILGIKN